MSGRRRGRAVSRVARTSGNQPIAIIGIGCRFPGADGPEELWDLLCAGRDAITEVPSSRFDIDAYYDPQPAVPGKIVTRWGGFLDRIDEFDAEFFGISPREAMRMDPQQRLLLETTWAALEDAGLTAEQLAGSATGVYVGQISGNYWERAIKSGILDIHTNAGAAARSITSGRLSFAFDLRGPSLTVDTACSSSLLAVHLACQSLRSGECTLAIAAGVNLVLSPEDSITFSQANMLSPTGRCKFGDASADGFVRSDGVGVVVLKPLDAAIADGDRIWAVILGSAALNEGQSSGYLMRPSEEGQEETLRLAYRAAGVDPAQVSYVEAHGTGTPAGDPVELRSLAAVLGRGRPADRPLLVGSLKTNIGHTEAAAGIAGLIKAALCLNKKAIPKSLHWTTPTPEVDWSRLPLRIVEDLRPFPTPEPGQPALAGVSSFGISGTNVHVVLSDYQPESSAPPAEPDDGRPYLLPLSAKGPEALRSLAAEYVSYLGPEAPGREVPLRDICYSAGVRRQHYDARLAVIGRSHQEIAEKLAAFVADPEAPDVRYATDVEATRPTVAFVFPGQGSQWTGMARELYESVPAFRDAMRECDRAIAAETGWSVIERLLAGEELTGIDVIQPALWAMEISLAALWRHWGFEPDVVLGHSMGEAAAAYVAGHLDLASSAAVICRRSALLRTVSGAGAMVSVDLSVADAEREIADVRDRVSVAVSNSPTSTVLAGDPEALEQLTERLSARGVFCRPIKVDVASHSPQMDALRADLMAALRDLTPRRGSVPMRSTVTTEVCRGPELDAAYWVRNLREPVRFAETVQRVLAEGPTLFIEMSPHPVLVPALRECLGEGQGLAVGSTRRDEPELAALLDSVAAIYGAGYPVPWAGLSDRAGRYTPLPRYPFQRQRFWLPDASPTRSPAATSATRRHHPLLGAHTTEPDGTHRWEGPVDLEANSYLADHRVQDTIVLPGTAYVDAVAAAAREVLPGATVLTDIEYRHAMVLSADRPTQMRVTVRRQAESEATFEVSSRSGGSDEWTVNAVGRVRTAAITRAPRPMRPDEVRARCPEHRLGADFYRRFATRGNQWGPAFAGITELWRRDGEALARVTPPAAIREALTAHRFHPALLDACGQVLAATLPERDGDADDAFVLGGIDRVRIYRQPRGAVWSHAVRTATDRADSFIGDVTIWDDEGVLAELDGLRLQYLSPPASEDTAEWLYALTWRRQPPAPVQPATGLWVVFADKRGIGQQLADSLPAPAEAIVVSAADRYRQIAPDRFEIDPAAPEHYARLLDELGDRLGRAPSLTIAHLWSLDVTWPDSVEGDRGAGQELGPDGAVPAWLADGERLGGASVVALVQALSAVRVPGELRLALVTAGAQRVSAADQRVHPGQATVWGLGRVLADEQPDLQCRLIDLPADVREAQALRAELLAAGTAEPQVALRADGRYVARLVRYASRAPHAPVPAVARSRQLVVPASGLLDDLRWEPVPERPPAPGEVVVEPRYSALNFRDALTALQAYPGQDQSAPVALGLECVGVVRAVGPGVAGVAVGDEVIALAHPTLATHVHANAHVVVPCPRGVSLQEAATLPQAYLTAYYALVTLAKLRPGERVLIHTATGGVGLAAIQVARWCGAEIIATAGSPAKRALLRAMGIRHVADSRSSFADDVRAMTRGAGVDVVFNTLVGAAIEENLSLLAPYGRYLELSKRDLREGGRIPLAPFDRGVTFFGVDVLDLQRTRPEQAGAILREIMGLVEAGVLPPLPHELFDLAEVTTALRRLASGRHVGKILLAHPAASPDGVDTVASDSRPAGAASAGDDASGSGSLPIRADATYLITGGLGDLGLLVARWLVDCGARHLLLLGRSPLPDPTEWADVDPADPAYGRVKVLRGLRDRGISVEYEAVDVGDAQALSRVLRRYEASGRPPIRGVIHAAGVVRFASVGELDAAALREASRAKVAGAWALHQYFARQPLDYLVLFSSGSALLGSPMLGCYAAANAGMDAVASHRRLAGLPATTINWGFWADAGMAARRAREQGQSLVPRGMSAFEPGLGLRFLRRLLTQAPSQVAVLGVDWTRWAEAYPRPARSPFFTELVQPDAAPAVREPDSPPSGDSVIRPSTTVPTAAARAEAEPSRAVEETRPADRTARLEPAPSLNGGAADGAGAPPSDGRPGRSQAELEEYLRRHISRVLGMPAERLNPRRPLHRQGLDSLMAVEVRTRVKRDIGVTLPLARMLGGITLQELAAEVFHALPAANGADTPMHT